MGKLSIQDIASVLVTRNSLEKNEAVRFVTAMFALVQERLEADRIVKVKGLGTFKIIDVEARESVSVRTGKRVVIVSHPKVTFTPDALMKDLVNKPFSQFETVLLNDGVEFEDLKEPDSGEETEVEAETEVAKETEPEKDTEDSREDDAHEDAVASAEPKLIPVYEPVESIVEEEPVQDDDSVEDGNHAEDDDPVEDGNTVEDDDPVQDDESFEDKEQTDDKETKENTVMDEEEKKERRKVLFRRLRVFLLMAASAAAGYYYGLKEGSSIPRVEIPIDVPVMTAADSARADSAAASAKAAESAKATETTQVAESSNIDSKEQPAETKPAVVKTAETKPAEAKPAETKPASPAPDKYAEMDVRVKYGAYRIVGDDFTVKVRAGDTTKRIAKRTLGEGMECYIEVYNNIKSNAELKEGQTIKIPKLQWKKKRK